MIRIALQSKGRLNEESLELLAEVGIDIERGKRRLLARAELFPIEALYLRDDDIPHAVERGVADLGIVGLNEYEERRCGATVVHKLGFGRCRLSLAIPKGEEYEGIGYFNGKRIATSYPVILRKFLKERNIEAKIEEIAGSVEIAPAVGMAEAIFDIVSSGGTLVSNGLKEVETAMHSEAGLIATPRLEPEKQALLNQLLFRIEAVERTRGKKYILMNIPTERLAEATGILPGIKSPTILPLAERGWSSLHAVVDERVLWEKIEQLKAIGAEDILVLTPEKMIL